MAEPIPGLTRRDLLRLGVAAGPAALLAACGWDGGPTLEPRLRLVSRLNDWVGEKIFLRRQQLAPQYPVSARTEAGHFPAYSITYNKTRRYPGAPESTAWVLEVAGLVRNPLRLTREMLE